MRLPVLLKQPVKNGRNGCFKMLAFAGDRVDKFQYRCMKRKTTQRICCGAVFFITGNTVPDAFQVNPYLIFSSGL